VGEGKYGLRRFWALAVRRLSSNKALGRIGPDGHNRQGPWRKVRDVANLDEAIAVVKTWPGDAKLELRPIVEMASVDNVPSAQTATRR
jgi:hypothetical protein